MDILSFLQRKKKPQVAMTFTCNEGKALELISDVAVSYEGKIAEGFKGQWDTGATGTCISQNVVDALNMKPYAKGIAHSPTGPKEVSMYHISLVLPGSCTVNDVDAALTYFGDENIDVLIGMDVITLGDFAVSNYNGRTMFSFRIPSMEETDYTKNVQHE